MITGVDLVEERVRIARGEQLRITQDQLRIQGHAIELRVYAEDVPAGFLPSTGVLATHVIPEGPGIRVDAGVEEGDVISIHYDPMISKLCAHGMDRKQAIERLRRRIDEYLIKASTPPSNSDGTCSTMRRSSPAHSTPASSAPTSTRSALPITSPDVEMEATGER